MIRILFLYPIVAVPRSFATVVSLYLGAPKSFLEVS